MRYLVMADIHANLEALEAVVRGARCDRVLLLGDLVGYGADPERALDRIQELDVAAGIRGNHDKVVAGLDDGEGFATHARQAAWWARGQLSAGNLQYLRRLPAGPIAVDSMISIAHGSPRDEDEYLLPGQAAGSTQFEAFSTPVCFFGHTHVPAVFSRIGGVTYSTGIEGCAGLELSLESTRYLINPGSVGQPRDHDPRAAFLVFDSDGPRVDFFRTDYDVASAQQKIRAAGLPEFLARRLERGT